MQRCSIRPDNFIYICFTSNIFFFFKLCFEHRSIHLGELFVPKITECGREKLVRVRASINHRDSNDNE